MQIGLLSYPPSKLWSLCLLTASPAVTVEPGSGSQLAEADEDKNWGRTDVEVPRKRVWRHEGSDRKEENME